MFSLRRHPPPSAKVSLLDPGGARFHTRALNPAGATIAEVVIAMLISAVAIAGGFLVNSEQLGIVKSARETGAAAGTLEERVEQLRTATWLQITDSNYLSTTYFTTPVKSIDAIPDSVERIAISAWPDATAATPLIVVRSPGAAPVVQSNGTGLGDQRMAKVDLRISWTGKDARKRMHELTTVISNGGISRMNLPGTSAGSGSSATPTPRPGNSGNSNGRGNVGGKPGQN